MLIILIGVGAGFLSGLLGVGGGTLLVPALVLLWGTSQAMAQGISLAVIIPTAALGGWAYYKKGNVKKELLRGMILGAVVGALVGASLANL